jgi:hypothetical protein
VKNTYHNVCKREKQESLFLELQKEIEKRREHLRKGYEFPDLNSRLSEAYRRRMYELAASKIGGTPEEQKKFFQAVLGKWPQCFWTEGCAPLVKDHVISFRLKPGAKPVARQPIQVSPYDDSRVEFHIEENVVQGKLRKIDTQREPLPEWSTPVFVVDQDAKGLLGRMVCAYGPVNKELEINTFPSADPQRAFDLAAFQDHHTVVDAIWGYTQFAISEETRKMLVVCSRSGL